MRISLISVLFLYIIIIINSEPASAAEEAEEIYKQFLNSFQNNQSSTSQEMRRMIKEPPIGRLRDEKSPKIRNKAKKKSVRDIKDAAAEFQLGQDTPRQGKSPRGKLHKRKPSQRKKEQILSQSEPQFKQHLHEIQLYPDELIHEDIHHHPFQQYLHVFPQHPIAEKPSSPLIISDHEDIRLSPLLDKHLEVNSKLKNELHHPHQENHQESWDPLDESDLLKVVQQGHRL